MPAYSTMQPQLQPQRLTSLPQLDDGPVHIRVLPPCQLYSPPHCSCLQQGLALAAIHLCSSKLRLKVLGGGLRGRGGGGW
jgi:hypothetical protein